MALLQNYVRYRTPNTLGTSVYLVAKDGCSFAEISLPSHPEEATAQLFEFQVRPDLSEDYREERTLQLLDAVEMTCRLYGCRDLCTLTNYGHIGTLVPKEHGFEEIENAGGLPGNAVVKPLRTGRYPELKDRISDGLFGARTRHILNDAGIMTFRDLFLSDPNRVKRLPGLGALSQKKISDAIRYFRLEYYWSFKKRDFDE